MHDTERYVCRVGSGTEQKSMALSATSVILPAGTRVMLHSLNKAELNGMWGCVTEFHDGDDRYSVQLDESKVVKI